MGANRFTRAAAIFGKVVTESIRAGLRTITSATVTLAVKDEGKTIVLDRAAGVTVTLPAATGSGRRFRIYNKTTVTSNAHIVQVANSSDIMQGTAWGAADGGATVNAWEAGAADDTMTMDGSTKGGLKGDIIELQDVATNVWSVQAHLQQTGVEATPFSSAV